MTDFGKLQTGSAIRTVTSGDAEGESARLSKETAGQIAGAFTYWLSQKVQKNPVMLNICIGHDTGSSCGELKEGVLEAISLWGATGHDAGVACAPAVFMSTIMPYYEIDGAIMISGGDDGSCADGFDFFTSEGRPEPEDIAEILRLASRYTFIGGVYEDNKINLMQMYSAYLRQMVSLGLAEWPGYLKGMHIIVDAGGGTAEFFADSVLAAMGAEVRPESCETASDLARVVSENHADLGIKFSEDGCRLSAAAPGGIPLDGDRMIALAAALAADDCPGATVLTGDDVSDELHGFLENELALKHVMYRSGRDNLVLRAKELKAMQEDVLLAADKSGCIAYAENYLMDDGLFAAVQIAVSACRLKKEGKEISSFITGLI